MKTSQLTMLGRLYGVADEEIRDPGRCARQLVRIWGSRGLSQDDVTTFTNITAGNYREICKMAGATFKRVPEIAEPELVNA